MSTQALSWKWEQATSGAAAVLELSGGMTINSLGKHWVEIMAKIREATPSDLRVRAAALSQCDASGMAFLRELERAQQERNGRFSVDGLQSGFQRVYDFMSGKEKSKQLEQSAIRATSIPEEVGHSVVNLIHDARRQIAFIGEIFAAFLLLFTGKTKVKARTLFGIMDRTGVNAIPIVCVIGFLLGLILAFQMVLPLKRFGVDLYVVFMVTVAMFRELGPLITAILLAARSGSAFAAELGTMKVNEEIDALNTMGLDPVRFLVVSRIAGVVLAIPILILMANALGIIGAALVMHLEGYASAQIMNMIQLGGRLGDLIGGLGKGMVFGLIVASVGCQRGLQTGLGASAVGESTTSAVVSGILWIAIADGIFSVIFWALGI